MGRDLAQSTVVITGASSGIDRAAALLFARRGSRIALAARGADELEELEVSAYVTSKFSATGASAPCRRRR